MFSVLNSAEQQWLWLLKYRYSDISSWWGHALDLASRNFICFATTATERICNGGTRFVNKLRMCHMHTHLQTHKRIPSLVCKSLFILESKYAAKYAHKVAAAKAPAAAAFYYFNFFIFFMRCSAPFLWHTLNPSTPLLLLLLLDCLWLHYFYWIFLGPSETGNMIMWALQTGSIEPLFRSRFLGASRG